MELTFYIALIVFIITYFIIVSEKVHRTVVALAGAVLMILLGVLNQHQAIEGVDFNTLGLLIGMMMIVSLAKHSGMFQFVAIWAAKKGKGKPIPIFILLGIITAVFSALLDNVTTVLLIVPIVFVIANNLKMNPIPYLFSTIIFSNLGGAATLIGDPPNILIGSAANLSFMDFIVHMGPIMILIFSVTAVWLYYHYRGTLVADPELQQKIMQFNPKDAITDYPLLWRSLFVIALVTIGFFTHGATHLEGATIALAGAALLLILTFNDPEAHLRDVEWTTIFFFIGLFILVAGLEHTGVIDMLATLLLDATNGNMLATALSILWGSAVFSAVVDNIPFVATMIPLVHSIGLLSNTSIQPLWWALALGADIGGNATIVGASANVVVKGMSDQAGHSFSFWNYAKVAIPVTFVGLAIASLYLFIRYF